VSNWWIFESSNASRVNSQLRFGARSPSDPVYAWLAQFITNCNTPYSWAWLDLRAEPIVVSVPALPDRYYVLQWFDLYTYNFAYIGSRATGNEAGDYLIAGPDWQGPTPGGIKQVLHSETAIVGTLTRTAWTVRQTAMASSPCSENIGSGP
jgi:hypothetical protein